MTSVHPRLIQPHPHVSCTNACRKQSSRVLTLLLLWGRPRRSCAGQYTAAELKRAFNRQARLNHPDKHRSERGHYEKKFQAIHEAYRLITRGPEATSSGATESGAESFAAFVSGPQKMAVSLPKHWRETIDKKSGKPFYFHAKTYQKTWTRPDENTVVAAGPEQASSRDVEFHASADVFADLDESGRLEVLMTRSKTRRGEQRKLQSKT